MALALLLCKDGKSMLEAIGRCVSQLTDGCRIGIYRAKENHEVCRLSDEVLVEVPCSLDLGGHYRCIAIILSIADKCAICHACCMEDTIYFAKDFITMRKECFYVLFLGYICSKECGFCSECFKLCEEVGLVLTLTCTTRGKYNIYLMVTGKGNRQLFTYGTKASCDEVCASGLESKITITFCAYLLCIEFFFPCISTSQGNLCFLLFCQRNACYSICRYRLGHRVGICIDETGSPVAIFTRKRSGKCKQGGLYGVDFLHTRYITQVVAQDVQCTCLLTVYCSNRTGEREQGQENFFMKERARICSCDRVPTKSPCINDGCRQFVSTCQRSDQLIDRSLIGIGLVRTFSFACATYFDEFCAVGAQGSCELLSLLTAGIEKQYLSGVAFYHSSFDTLP